MSQKLQDTEWARSWAMCWGIHLKHGVSTGRAAGLCTLLAHVSPSMTGWLAAGEKEAGHKKQAFMETLED